MDKCTEKIRKGRGRVNRTPRKCKKTAWNEEKDETTLVNWKITLRS